MSYICTKCGLISEKKVSRCPECFGRVRFFPQDAKRLEGAIRDSQILVYKVKNIVSNNLEQAEKHLEIGSDHIFSDYFDSAVNSFRKSMEYLLNSWCLLLSGNNYFYELRAWICWKQELRCKDLDDVMIKPVDQISFCRDIGLISQTSHNDFEYLRETGNRGSHAGNETQPHEAQKAEELLQDVIEDFKQFYTNLAAYTDTPEWRCLKRAQSNALALYTARLGEDANFLEDKNDETQDFIDRKSSYLPHASNWRERQRVESEIAKAKQQLSERQKEIDAIIFTHLQLIQECELLRSVYDPAGYESLKASRAAYRQTVVEEEKRLERQHKILTYIGIGAAIVAIVFILPYLVFGM